MKKLLSLAACALLLSMAACKNGGYKITGTATGAQDGDTVILAEVHSMFEIDTIQTVVVKDGQFLFEGVQDTAAMRYVIWNSTTDDDLAVATQFVLENGDITIKLDTAQNVAATISGTPVNEALSALAQKEMDINAKAQDVLAVFNDPEATDEARANAEQLLNGLQDELSQLYKTFITENLQNVAGQTYLAGYAGMLGDEFVVEQLAAIPEDNPYHILDKVREIYDIKAQTAVGKPYKDIKAQTPEGAELAVSDVAAGAKVLMIDFWASWCGPCRAEMPYVKAAYDKYHDQGFDIIGVSLDQDAEDWKQAIETLGMTWPQISDLKGWECEGADLYGVRSIPATVLIKEGIIVARDLRGEKLAEKVEELLNGQ